MKLAKINRSNRKFYVLAVTTPLLSAVFNASPFSDSPTIIESDTTTAY
jgi:hypothetical protein